MGTGIAANRQLKKVKWEDDPYLAKYQDMATKEMAQYNANPTQNMTWIHGNNQLMDTLRMLNEQNVRNRARTGGSSEGALAANSQLGELAVKGRMDLLGTAVNAQENALVKAKDAMNQVRNNALQKRAFAAAKAEQYAANLGKIGASVSQGATNYIMANQNGYGTQAPRQSTVPQQAPIIQPNFQYKPADTGYSIYK